MNKKLKNRFRVVLCVFCACLLACVICPRLSASDVTLSTYYPAPFGQYERIRLVPRQGTDLSGTCPIGSLYVNSSGALRYCHSNAGTGEWGPLTEIWTQNVEDVYLTDTDSNDQLHVGIGTATPTFKLTIQDDNWILAKGTFGSGEILPSLGAGSRFIWYPKKAALRAGYVDGTQWDDINIGDYSSAMGRNTIANGPYSVVGGGDNNIASGQHSVVIGGQNNTASGNKSGVGGGLNNTASGNYAMLYGGRGNTASADYSLIIGGHNNQVTKTTLTPPLSDVPAIASVIGGGEENIVKLPYSYIGGGSHNTIAGPFTTTIPQGYAVVGGGSRNTAGNDYTVVLGGDWNNAVAPYASIGGGYHNIAGHRDPDDGTTGSYSVISGGLENTVIFDYAVISGGNTNYADGPYSVIGGGWNNGTYANFSIVGGGQRNGAGADYSTIMGGTDNNASGDYSWAEGRNMQLSATADRTFVWGYSDTPVAIDTSDAFIVAPGTISGSPWNPKVGIRDRTPAAVLEINAAGSLTDNYLTISNTSMAGGAGNVFIVKNNGVGSPYIGVNKSTPTVAANLMEFGPIANGAYQDGQWHNGSSRKHKENIIPLSSQEAEKAVDELNPVTFYYKALPQQKNIGFIAEDVPDLVAMKDRRSLSTLDIVAVLTKVVQDQDDEIRIQNDRLQKIRTEIKELKKSLGE